MYADSQIHNSRSHGADGSSGHIVQSEAGHPVEGEAAVRGSEVCSHGPERRAGPWIVWVSELHLQQLGDEWRSESSREAAHHLYLNTE